MTRIDPRQVASVRRFNRFHTRLVGALNEHMLKSPFSLPQLRVVYELANAPAQAPHSASSLARALEVDAGYLSRLLTSLENDGIVEREPDADHGKRLTLALTKAGRKQYAKYDAAAAAQVQAVLTPLSVAEREELVDAMTRIRRYLGDEIQDRTVVLRDPRVGELGLIVHRQAVLYSAEYGWDDTFEALLARIVSDFVRQFVPGRERCWVADVDGAVAGSVFVVRVDDQTARLRMLYVEPWARGLGLGRRLVDECLQFASERGYTRLVLSTNRALKNAISIYKSAGFVRVLQETQPPLEHAMADQEWERTLADT